MILGLRDQNSARIVPLIVGIVYCEVKRSADEIFFFYLVVKICISIDVWFRLMSSADDTPDFISRAETKLPS